MSGGCVGVGVVVLVLARLRSRPTHAWRRRTGAGGLVVAALLERHRSQAHDGARGGAPRREQQTSQARAHQVCRPLQPFPWPTAPEHPRTPPSRVLPVSTRRRSCCASLLLRTTISVWNTPRRSLPSKRSAWRSRCAPSQSWLRRRPDERLGDLALVHLRQGAQPRTSDGGPDSKSAHSKTSSLKRVQSRADEQWAELVWGFGEELEFWGRITLRVPSAFRPLLPS